MRSALFISLLLLVAAAAYAQPPGQAINPHTQIRWPLNCHELGARRLGRAGVRSAPGGMVYNFINNTCIDMNAIDPGKQLVWPTNCGANQVYVPLTNTCITNGAAANPAGNPMEVQFNQNGVFGGTTGLQYDNAGGIIATAGGLQGQSVGGSCYAKQWQTGGGNNGISNAMANCAAVIADPSYATTDAPTAATFTPTPFHYTDQRSSFQTEFFRNPGRDASGNQPGYNRFGIVGQYGNGAYCQYDQNALATPDQRLYCNSIKVMQLNPGTDYGMGWQVGTDFTLYHVNYAAGTGEIISTVQMNRSVGDEASFYCYDYSMGGEVAGSAEGIKCFAGVTLEDSVSYGASVTNGPNTGTPNFYTNPIAMTANVLAGSNSNYVGIGVGRYLIPLGTCTTYPGSTSGATNVTTQNCPAAPYSGLVTSSLANPPGFESGLTRFTLNIPIPPSTAWGTIPAAGLTPTYNPALPLSSPATFAVTIKGGTTGTSSAFTTSSLVCFASGYHECEYPTAAPAPVGGVQTITVPIRKPHYGNTTIFQGGLTGTCIFPSSLILAPTPTPEGSMPIRTCYDVLGSPNSTASLTGVTAVGATTTYSGTGLSGFCSTTGNGGSVVTVSGFANSGNNGSYVCASSTATTLVLNNPNGVTPDTNSGTASISQIILTRFGLGTIQSVNGFDASYGILSSNLSSSGTTVTANYDSGTYKPSPGASILITGSDGNAIDGQCNGVTYTTASSFTCTNPNLTGPHSSTNTTTHMQLMTTNCYKCNTTTSGLTQNAFAIYPAAEVIDVRKTSVVVSFSITASVLTVVAPNTFSVGQQVVLSNFSTGTYLNGKTVTIATVSGSQFTAPFSYATNVASTLEGNAYAALNPPAVDGTSFLLEPNILGNLANGSHIEQVHHVQGQYQGSTLATTAYNTLTSSYNSGITVPTAGIGMTGGGYTTNSVATFKGRNDNPDSMYLNQGGMLSPQNVLNYSGAYYVFNFANHFPDAGGALLGVASAPSYQLNDPNFLTYVGNLAIRTGTFSWSLRPYSGDNIISTPGASTYSAASHSFNGPVNNLANDAGLVSGIGMNYVLYSNDFTQNSYWRVIPVGVATCGITDDLGYPACTLAPTGNLNISNAPLVGSPTPLTLGQTYSISARMQGTVGGEQVILSFDAAIGATQTLTTAWANYCVTQVASRSASLATLAQINFPAAATIHISNVVVRLGTSCGPPILTTTSQILTPTPVNRFPGTAMRAGSWTLTSATSTAVTFTTAMPSTPASCAITPSADPSTVFPLWTSALSATGFTINAHTSGTISGTYLCAVNNSN